MVKKRPLPSPLPLLDERFLLDELDRAGIAEVWGYRVWYAAIKYVLSQPRDVPLEQFSIQEAVKCMVHSPPKGLAEILTKFAIFTSRISVEQRSSDGTIKLAVQLHDGLTVEAVLIPHHGESRQRVTLCVSSQVGCAMACNFCSTGTMGLNGNLNSGEILEQMLHASRIAPIRNVVYMGMGEPLAENLDAVLASLRGLFCVKRFGLARKHVTVSTVGCTPGMRRLTKEAPGVHLAVSLHAPNQVLRNEIVPSARAFHLDSILDAMDKHICTAGPNSKRKQRGFIEYIVIHGVNDSEDCAHQLGELLGSRDVIVNLIPYNASTADEMFKEPPEHQVQQFRSIIASYGFMCTVRRPHGRDIAGACGQLAVEVKNQRKAGAKDIEDLLLKDAMGKRTRTVKGKAATKGQGLDEKQGLQQFVPLPSIITVGALAAVALIASGISMKHIASARR